MFRILRIEGESMTPEFNDGDYVLVQRLALLFRRIKTGSTVVFNTGKYGILIKKVSAADKKNRKYFFAGTSPKSLTTEQIGTVDERDIIGSVLFHFRK